MLPVETSGWAGLTGCRPAAWFVAPFGPESLSLIGTVTKCYDNATLMRTFYFMPVLFGAAETCRTLCRSIRQMWRFRYFLFLFLKWTWTDMLMAPLSFGTTMLWKLARMCCYSLYWLFNHVGSHWLTMQSSPPSLPPTMPLLAPLQHAGRLVCKVETLTTHFIYGKSGTFESTTVWWKSHSRSRLL